MSDIRACTADDIPAVARIFQKAHRDPRKPAPASLEACLKELFFDHPWYDPELSSRVYVAPDGSVGGFIGVVPLHMSYRGSPVRAAVPTSLAVERPDLDPLAGAKLVRSFLNGPQEISISEPANYLSIGMWERLGGQSIPSESMEWLRVFRPAGLALALLAERFSPAMFGRPIGQLLDRVADRFTGDAARFAVKERSFAHDADVGDDVLMQHLPTFAATYPLHPDWDPVALKWMLDHASHHHARGPLYRRMVYGKNDKPLGCYLYQGRPGRVAWVLQILALPDALDGVLDSLFAHAYRQGSVALKGRTQQRLLDPLLKRGCIFYRRASAVVHSRNPELLAAVRSGGAITSGFAAESWMRLIGEKFA
jgi:hypothetical protein